MRLGWHLIDGVRLTKNGNISSFQDKPKFLYAAASSETGHVSIKTAEREFTGCFLHLCLHVIRVNLRTVRATLYLVLREE
jgi:hypothetical protein